MKKIYVLSSFVMLVERFLSSSPLVFIVGASLAPEKFGYKVLDWYIKYNNNSKGGILRIVPIHPKERNMMGLETFPSINAFLAENNDVSSAPSSASSLKDAAVHFISPPVVTMSVIQEWTLDKAVIRKIWCQPGSIHGEDGKRVESFLSNSKSNSKSNSSDYIFLYDGPCILRDGPPLINNKL